MGNGTLYWKVVCPLWGPPQLPQHTIAPFKGQQVCSPTPDKQASSPLCQQFLKCTVLSSSSRIWHSPDEEWASLIARHLRGPASLILHHVWKHLVPQICGVSSNLCAFNYAVPTPGTHLSWSIPHLTWFQPPTLGHFPYSSWMPIPASLCPHSSQLAPWCWLHRCLPLPHFHRLYLQE